MSTTQLDAMSTAAASAQVAPHSDTVAEAMQRSVRAAVSERRKQRVIVLTLQIILLAGCIFGWEYSANSGLLPNARIFYGQPSGIADVLWSSRGDLWESLLATMKAALGGFAIGVVLAIGIGVLLAQVNILNRIFDPFLVVLAGLPRIALAPLFILWFGINDTAKIALSVSLVLFTVLFNVRAGVQSVDRDLITVARTFGTSRVGTLTKVIFPASVPVLFAALRLALIFSILGVIASEMTAAKTGLGLDVVTYAQSLRPNGMFAVLVVLGATMTSLNWILRVAERRLLRWVPD